MGLEKVGTTIGKEIIALTRTCNTRVFASNPVNIKGLNYAFKLKGDAVQIARPLKSASVPNILTNMTENLSSEFSNIDRALVKASSVTDFQNLANRINCLTNSSERNILMQKFLSRFKVFKNPFNGIKNNFSQIFGRELSNQEVVQLCQKYKNIFREQDNLKFLSNLYMQAMRDFGINPNKLQFKLCNVHPSNVASVTKEGHIFNLYVGNGACLNNPENRIKAMNAIFHELTHLKQNMIAYGTNSEAYIEAIARYSLKKGYYQGKNLGEVKEIIKTNVQRGVLTDAVNINLHSEMGQKGLKYINGNLNYISSSECQLQYMEQLIEKEAFEAGNNAEQSIRFILAGLL